MYEGWTLVTPIEGDISVVGEAFNGLRRWP
jgi:hypothetical protein